MREAADEDRSIGRRFEGPSAAHVTPNEPAVRIEPETRRIEAGRGPRSRRETAASVRRHPISGWDHVEVRSLDVRHWGLSRVARVDRVGGHDRWSTGRTGQVRPGSGSEDAGSEAAVIRRGLPFGRTLFATRRRTRRSGRSRSRTGRRRLVDTAAETTAAESTLLERGARRRFRRRTRDFVAARSRAREVATSASAASAIGTALSGLLTARAVATTSRIAPALCIRRTR